ncbi:hypothetical protein ACFO1B_03110 [Dactylosporangium siamense]|uniref:Uncharacterized protein n=1 Tax=Dactylosporangium siamense TaxID=685454 RepID=A0A919PJ44_9ACTN|nr:hypothetical protein [Dactylosporangium siamense]GIG43133.1 hypothetical protein Dsi01nite_011740 [Dactylosporangium siamense]
MNHLADLRALDAATPPTADQLRRAEATLDRILAVVPPAKRRHRALLLVPAAAAAAAVVAAAFLVGAPGPAYSSWTSEPTPLTAEETGLVGPACRDALDGGSLDLRRARLVLAERRGDFAVLLFRTEDPDMSGSCLARQPRGTDDVDDVQAAVGGGDGPAMTAPPRGYTQGALAGYRHATITDGAAGSDVTGVTIRAGDLTVHASVRDGRYVAWWPAQTTGDLSYDLTLTDGTVIRDARPTRPS